MHNLLLSQWLLTCSHFLDLPSSCNVAPHFGKLYDTPNFLFDPPSPRTPIDSCIIGPKCYSSCNSYPKQMISAKNKIYKMVWQFEFVDIYLWKCIISQHQIYTHDLSPGLVAMCFGFDIDAKHLTRKNWVTMQQCMTALVSTVDKWVIFDG